MGYATLDDLTSYLGIDDSTADDLLLLSMLTRAQAIIDSHTRRRFEADADTVRYHDAGSVQGRRLLLDGDCCAITAIVNGNGETIATSDWRTLPRGRTPFYGVELLAGSAAAWDTDANMVAVTGRWAYSVTAPADVEQACVRLAAWLYRQKDNTGNDMPMIAGNVTILPARLPADVLDLLKHYRRVA